MLGERLAKEFKELEEVIKKGLKSYLERNCESCPYKENKDECINNLMIETTLVLCLKEDFEKETQGE